MFRPLEHALIALLLVCFSSFHSRAEETGATLVADEVRSIIQMQSSRLSYSDAKMRFDALVDPSIDIESASVLLDRLELNTRKMLETLPEAEAVKGIEKLRALKALVYQPGWWNDDRPFEYDHDDPLGENIHNKLLATYLDKRKGNCVSMPVLFLILGERLGLDLTLSTAPLHVLVKYTDDTSGETYNLEATSGAGFTRDSWYQKKSPMTAASIENGVYLKNLNRQETLAVMATVVLEHLLIEHRYNEAIAVSDVLLEAYPEYVYVMVKRGTVFYHLLQDELQRTSNANTRSALADHYYAENQRSFEAAEALGWRAADH